MHLSEFRERQTVLFHHPGFRRVRVQEYPVGVALKDRLNRQSVQRRRVGWLRANEARELSLHQIGLRLGVPVAVGEAAVGEIKLRNNCVNEPLRLPVHDSGEPLGRCVRFPGLGFLGLAGGRPRRSTVVNLLNLGGAKIPLTAVLFQVLQICRAWPTSLIDFASRSRPVPAFLNSGASMVAAPVVGNGVAPLESDW